MVYFGWKRGLPGTIEAIVDPESKDTFQFLGGTAGNGKGIHPPEVRGGSLLPEGVKQGGPKRRCRRWGITCNWVPSDHW